MRWTCSPPERSQTAAQTRGVHSPSSPPRACEPSGQAVPLGAQPGVRGRDSCVSALLGNRQPAVQADFSPHCRPSPVSAPAGHRGAALACGSRSPCRLSTLWSAGRECGFWHVLLGTGVCLTNHHGRLVRSRCSRVAALGSAAPPTRSPQTCPRRLWSRVSVWGVGRARAGASVCLRLSARGPEAAPAPSLRNRPLPRDDLGPWSAAS